MPISPPSPLRERRRTNSRPLVGYCPRDFYDNSSNQFCRNGVSDRSMSGVTLPMPVAGELFDGSSFNPLIGNGPIYLAALASPVKAI